MTVYVDRLFNWGWKLGPSCHLMADDVTELHAFAKRVGLKRAWFQDGALPHYDLTAKRRSKAVELGATESTRADVRRLLVAHRERKAAQL